MIRVLFTAGAAQWAEYEPHLRKGFAASDAKIELVTETSDPSSIDYMIYAPSSTVQDFAPYDRLRAVLNLWAGVENVVGNPTLHAPLCRMVDPGLTEGMVEWVVGHTLRYHLEMDRHIHGQDGTWQGDWAPPLARQRTVCILGIGALGCAVAEALVDLRFQVAGWSRRLKDVEGVTCYAGQDGLRRALAGAEIVVLLTPSTPDTENLLDAQTLSDLPRGARIINPGRGPLINDDALLEALGTGHIAHATLDVFRQEPLPPQHPYWAHPNVTVTPHIASVTRADTAAQSVVDNILGHLRGEPLRYQVDKTAGY
jgi:glyoxylate/hydroxypyruvate reductase A